MEKIDAKLSCNTKFKTILSRQLSWFWNPRTRIGQVNFWHIIFYRATGVESVCWLYPRTCVSHTDSTRLNFHAVEVIPKKNGHRKTVNTLIDIWKHQWNYTLCVCFIANLRENIKNRVSKGLPPKWVPWLITYIMYVVYKCWEKTAKTNVLLLFGKNEGKEKKITNMCFHFSPLYLDYVYCEQTRRYTTKRIITVTV